MCNSKINGRPVLQPAGNRVPIEPGRITKKPILKPIHSSPPLSPKSPLNLNTEKPVTSPAIVQKSSKKYSNSNVSVVLPLDSFSTDTAPGSIAAAQREQALLMHAQRKMKIAHYGRTHAKLEASKIVPIDHHSSANATVLSTHEEKRCSFITPNSDPIYVAYHDEEWGVPVHDDKMLFELLVLTGAQVGLDWTTILKKRNDFREAFAGFDAENMSKFTERRIAAISINQGMDLGRVRGIINNAKRILEVKKEFGSLDKYLWSFVNYNPIITNYKSCRKIPVKTSKSETISKDLVRRGFRFVGPTVIHSFMQAAGFTNDHLLHCPRHKLIN
ncbi:Methyladenine glycosylase protein [Dioscorea alata]|uniref:Methyladenine glycosylase protein n=1 Tax=Dioscorea alata TaxID=55571 RepID=A0ACB7VNC8_DIOAL|nr:Methyladenine glycosylase protein [Dioscorea alata]